MRLLWQVSLCCLLASGIAVAQRGGGGMRGGGYVGGMPGGMGGGNFGGFRVGIAGGARFHSGFGATRIVFVGRPTALGFPANSIGLNSANVSFPFGLGFPAGPLGFPNSLSLPNSNNLFFSTGFPGFNNGILPNRGFNNGFWGGLGGWGYGVGGIGTLPDSSYWPRYDSARYDSYQPSPSVAFAYSPEQNVQPLSAERARPVTREYDQSGREIPTSVPAERSQGVIHEYDQSGREIPR